MDLFSFLAFLRIRSLNEKGILTSTLGSSAFCVIIDRYNYYWYDYLKVCSISIYLYKHQEKFKVYGTNTTMSALSCREQPTLSSVTRFASSGGTGFFNPASSFQFPAGWLLRNATWQFLWYHQEVLRSVQRASPSVASTYNRFHAMRETVWHPYQLA